MIATRAEALDRLAAFVPHAGRTYAATRNEDRGPADRTNVSVLSPYVRARLITEDEILRAVLARHSLSGAEKFVQEVLWRTYWKGWLESRPLVWTHYRRDLDAQYARLGHEADRARMHAEAIEGRTGIAAFDAWTHELIDHGYLHNHARMWYASIWIFTLQLPWEFGADFFMQHLLDGDAASNTLSWRWVAGLQTRGKTYLATAGNISRYTNGRLSVGTRLATEAHTIDGPAYSPGKLPDLQIAPHANERSLLVVHDDDAGLDSLNFGGLDIVASMGLCAVSGRSPQPVSREASTFAYAAIADALERAPHGTSAAIVHSDNRETAAQAIAAAAKANNATLIATPYMPIGPVRDAFTAMKRHFDTQNLRVIEVGRAFDAAVWPYATRGFFNLKEKIPDVLTTLGILQKR
jgi:deoxyribodipyrimidine photo-lyase